MYLSGDLCFENWICVLKTDLCFENWFCVLKTDFVFWKLILCFENWFQPKRTWFESVSDPSIYPHSPSRGRASGLCVYRIAGNFDGCWLQRFDGNYFDGWSLSFTKHCIALKSWRVKFWRSGWKVSKTSKFPEIRYISQTPRCCCILFTLL